MLPRFRGWCFRCTLVWSKPLLLLLGCSTGLVRVVSPAASLAEGRRKAASSYDLADGLEAGAAMPGFRSFLSVGGWYALVRVSVRACGIQPAILRKRAVEHASIFSQRWVRLKLYPWQGCAASYLYIRRLICWPGHSAGLVASNPINLAS